MTNRRTTHRVKTSTADEPRMRHAPAASGQSGPTLLTEAELELVAAAGSKLGGVVDGRTFDGSKPGGAGDPVDGSKPGGTGDGRA